MPLMGAKKIFGTKANAAHAVIAQTGAPSSIKSVKMPVCENQTPKLQIKLTMVKSLKFRL